MGGRGFVTSLLGTSVHRKLLTINELSAYNVSRSDMTGEDISYRSFLEMSQPSGRDRYGKQNTQYTASEGDMKGGSICAWMT